MIFLNRDDDISDDIYEFGSYHPYRRGHNPNFDTWSGYILDIKEENNPEENLRGARFFYFKLNAFLSTNFTIAIVPSSNAANPKPGMRMLVNLLCQNQRINGSDCLTRSITIKKATHGGPRDINEHLRTIIANNNLVRGKEILLLDDVVTTGSSLDACKQILLNADAARVKCAALGKTSS